MHAQIIVVMDSNAFKVSPGEELARILRQVARYVSGKDHLGLKYTAWTLRDINSHAVGQITISSEEK